MMGAAAARGIADYCQQLATFAVLSLVRLIRSPLCSRQSITMQCFFRNGILLFVCCGMVIIILMLTVDVSTIHVMPPRGDPSLWLVRIFTDFAKSAYVLWTLAICLIAIAVVAPRLSGMSRTLLAMGGLRIQFLFLSVAVPNLFGYFIKGIVGRGRPFVGGATDAFNYFPFAWREQFASFPSSHATTSFALAVAVASVWPRTRYIMGIYALLIAMSRVVLLAHYPSDVLAGALIGVVGALSVRQWFAARRLGFIIDRDGHIEPLPGLSLTDVKRVAARVFAP